MKVKSKLLILGLAISLILVPSVLVSGNPFELSGGGFYTTLTMTDLNDAIEDYNNSIDQISQQGVSATKMDKINQSIGFYGGAEFNLNNMLAAWVGHLIPFPPVRVPKLITRTRTER